MYSKIWEPGGGRCSKSWAQCVYKRWFERVEKMRTPCLTSH